MIRPHFIALAFLLMVAPSVRAAERETQPPPAAPRKATFATPQTKRLENGLQVIVVERPELPLVSAVLVIGSGAEADPQGSAGLASMTASLLTKGTETRTAPQIAEAIETLGASVESGAGWDYSFVKLSVISTQLQPALEIVADLVTHATFKDEEIERLRKQTLDELRVEMQEPGKVAAFAAAKVVFGDTPYGHPANGTAETVGALKRADIVKLHRTCYRPSNAIVALSGNITPEQGFELVQKLFGDWTSPKEELPRTSFDEAALPARRTTVIDMPTAGQAAVMLVKPGIARLSKEYFEGEVANAVLGVGYSSRLNEEIRVKRGLSYGAGSGLEARRLSGRFIASAQTKNESAVEVATLMLRELKELGTHPVKSAELATRKAALTGEFARRLETNAGFASEVAKLALYGLPPASLNSYLDQVQGVTAEQVQSFAKKYMVPAQASVLIVGNAKLFRQSLLETFKGALLIKEANLDLNKSSLHR